MLKSYRLPQNVSAFKMPKRRVQIVFRDALFRLFDFRVNILFDLLRHLFSRRFHPIVTFFFEFEREFLAAFFDDLAACENVNKIRRDVI